MGVLPVFVHVWVLGTTNRVPLQEQLMLLTTA